jgi:glycosyltransferase involved in cell wall biosynthesis
MSATNRWIFVAWAPHGRRTELLAKELQIKSYFIHYLKFQVPRYAPLKYILQALRTFQVLLKERPTVVFAQNPPFFCSLVAYLYCRLTRSKFVIDHHSDVFSSRWKWALSIQRFLARRALTNLVTNQHWADIVKSWSADVFILPDPFVTLPEVESLTIKPGFNVVFINTFALDEPIEAVLEAASQLPEVHFYITGNTKKKPASFFASIPANVTFTGFLPDQQYFGLLRAAQAVMSLTTRNYTLQGGGCEAVSLGKALITSDWPYLRELFAKGTIYVSNSSDSIRDGILRMQYQYRDLEKEIAAFRENTRQEWDLRFVQLKEIIVERADSASLNAQNHVYTGSRSNEP